MGAERIQWMDALKLFGIFLVIMGHCIQYLLSSVYYDEPIFRLIYSFHMPLFMTVSGFFSAHICGDTFKRFLAKKSRQLLLPALSFDVIYCILSHYINGGGGIRHLRRFGF